MAEPPHKPINILRRTKRKGSPRKTTAILTFLRPGARTKLRAAASHAAQQHIENER